MFEVEAFAFLQCHTIPRVDVVCRETAAEVWAGQAVPWPLHASDERQCAGRPTGEILFRQRRADLDQRAGA